MSSTSRAISGYYYLGAAEALGNKQLNDYLGKITRGIDNGGFRNPGINDKTAEPTLYFALVSSTAIKEAFGIETDGKILTIDPLFGHSEDVGMKNIAFARNNYDILFDKENVYILSDEEGSVKIRVGGFYKEQKIMLSVVEDGKIVSNELVKADKSGNLILSKKFGDTSYVKLEPVIEQ